MGTAPRVRGPVGNVREGGADFPLRRVSFTARENVWKSCHARSLSSRVGIDLHPLSTQFVLV